MASNNTAPRTDRGVSPTLMLWLCLTTLPEVFPLIAYDCQNPSTNITVISLKDVAQCPDPDKGYVTIQKFIRVLQKERYSHIHVKACLVEVTRLIMYCGAFSHMSLVKDGIYSAIHKVGEEGCQHIHRYNEYTGWSGRLITNIKPNSTTTASFTLAGSVSMNGKCDGTTYIENGNTWENVIVSATVKIQLTDYEATLKIEQNEVVLRGGVVCPYLDGYCLDTQIGETTWSPTPTDNCELYAELYRGPGSLVQQASTTSTKTIHNYVVVEQEDRVFALSLIKPIHICQEKYWLTEHPQLVVVESEVGLRTSKIQHISPEDVDLRAYTDSKFLCMEHSLKTSLHNMYAYAVYRRCQLRREILKNRLTMAPLSPNTISAIIKENLGYVGKVAGEVLYIMQCTPRTATLRKVNHCYIELPVLVDNTSYFMSPITHILQRYAEPIACNPVIPPAYYLNEEWISLTPVPVRIRRDPIELQVDEEAKLMFAPMQSISVGGLYSEAEIRQAQDAMLFGMERKAITSMMASKILGEEDGNQDVNMLRMFSPEELEQLAQSTLEKMWGWFTWLGTFTSGILGLVFTWKMCKFVLEVLINAIAIHKVHGFTLKLFASLWDTMTLYVLHHGAQKKQKKEADLEMVPLEEKQEELQGVSPSAPSPYTPVTHQLTAMGV